MVIYQSECMGKILHYVITPCGNYLYKQRKLNFSDWQNRLAKLLYNAKYEVEEIPDIIKCYSTKNWYMNEIYYKQPDNIVQRVNELGADWIIDVELSRYKVIFI